MLFLLAKNENFWLCLVILTSLACLRSSVNAIACNASSIKSCPALLNYVPKTPTSIEETASLFHVSTDSVHKTSNASVVAISCGCAGYQHNEFTYHTLYTVKPGDTWDVISSKFGFLVVEKSDKALIPTMNITLDILCGCYEHMEILTYRIESGDTLYTICARFGANEEITAKVNKLKNQNLIYAGELLYIPNPESLKYLTAPYAKDSKTKTLVKSQIYIIIGTTVAAVAVVLSLGTFIFWKYYYKSNRPSKAYLMRYLPCDITSMPSYSKSEGSIVLSVSSDRATDFPYSEVSNATVNFSTSRKIGQGSYGSVYLGNLRGQDVAIKQMKNTKSREFQSEINTLCNVHHSNLIQLIGYAAGGDSLFLVYEFAQNGALSEHLHNPSVRGYKPLSWVTRVQIALDAAQGLEYIHVHTKPYYVHRDVKTSNILLDSRFRAKIADFGLAKLLEQSADTGTTASRLVGTFGYLAPEYVRDGCLTAKSDVYAFGVVLMELITGQPALSVTASSIHIQYGEHRSLVDYMISALECNDPMAKLTKHIDPELSHYHKDSLLQLAFLSRDCVDDDWKRRPDMTKVVLYLSQILTRTKEWHQTNCTDQNA